MGVSVDWMVCNSVDCVVSMDSLFWGVSLAEWFEVFKWTGVFDFVSMDWVVYDVLDCFNGLGGLCCFNGLKGSGVSMD